MEVLSVVAIALAEPIALAVIGIPYKVAFPAVFPQTYRFPLGLDGFRGFLLVIGRPHGMRNLQGLASRTSAADAKRRGSREILWNQERGSALSLCSARGEEGREKINR